MFTLWDTKQMDAFLADITDGLVAGFELRVASATLEGYSQVEFDDLEKRVKRVLFRLVDLESDEFNYFNPRRQLILSRRPDEVLSHLVDRINASSLERCRAMRPEDWGAGPRQPRIELTPEEERAAHQRTIHDTAVIRDRFESILRLPEKTLAALDRARIADLEVRELARAERRLNRPAPAPEQQQYGVSPRGAELLVRDWMRHLGFLSAEVTQERSDGGVDVTSDTHVAQVKNYKGNVSVVEIRELFGVATSLRRQALFFTSGGFTAEGVRLADAIEIPLLHYTAESGLLAGVNDSGKELVAEGFHTAR